ncbi:MAG: response regulator [Panacagrimonas sp.]
MQTVRRLADALNQLRQFSFSCVLVDLGLPDAEGTTPVRRIREADPGVAIVVLSGRQDDRVAGQALALGAQDYRVKGQCWGEDLLHVIRRAIDRTGTPSQASQAQAAAGVAGAERGDPGGRTRVALTALERVSVISNR